MKARLTTTVAVIFLVAAGAWGASRAVAEAPGPAGPAQTGSQEAGYQATGSMAAATLARKTRKVEDRLDFVNYRRTWRTYYA